MTDTFDRDFHRKQFQKMSYRELAIAFKELKAKMKEHEDKKALLSNIFDVLTIDVIPDRMAQDDMVNTKIKGVGRIELRPGMWTSTKDADALGKWLREHDLGDLIKPTVNGSTLKSVIKELQERGDEIPPEDVVSVTPYIRASVVGSG